MPFTAAEIALGVEHVGHDADLVFPDVVVDLAAELLLEHVIHGETQLGLGQCSCIGRIAEHYGLGGDLCALVVRSSEDDNQVVGPVLVG